MSARIGRLWRRRPAENGLAHDTTAVASKPDDTLPPDAEDGTAEMAAVAPEQPVLLASVGVSRQVHVGDVLPPVRARWPGRLARLPEVPKRAILAAGVCAGLAAPAITRHLAMRLLSGPVGGRSGAQATLEITRIVFHGPLTAEAISTIQKALTAGRR